MSGGPYGRGKAPERACLKLAAWPTVDQALWQAAIQPAGVFDDGGDRADQRPRSNDKVEKGYGRWLTFLTYNAPEALVEAPADRITRERVKAYVRHLESLGNSTQTLLCRLQELGEMARVMGPDRDLKFIALRASRIRARHVPARDKDDKLVMSDDLLELGLTLMEEAAMAATPRQRASLYRDGLLIAMLALEPLRRRNIASLTLGRSLHRQGDVWLIVLGRGETKTHAPIDCLWPPMLVPHLEHYLSVHRPYLACLTGRWSAPVGDSLWVSTDGSPMTEMAIYDRVRLHTKERLGVAENLHGFRHAAATTLAIEAPEHIHAAAPLLTHASFGTTQKHYILRAKRLSSHRKFTKVLSKKAGWR